MCTETCTIQRLSGAIRIVPGDTVRNVHISVHKRSLSILVLNFPTDQWLSLGKPIKSPVVSFMQDSTLRIKSYKRTSRIFRHSIRCGHWSGD